MAQHCIKFVLPNLPGSQAHPWPNASVANYGRLISSARALAGARARSPALNPSRRLPDMSTEVRLAELERRHSALEAEIAKARAHPSIDDLQIVELKRRKLVVKDEIARLQN
jgi:hypothetical protein